MSTPWLPGDVYFGDAEKPLPDWRKEEEGTDSEEGELTEEERAGLIGVLGFDPSELWKEEKSVNLDVSSSLQPPTVKKNPLSP